MARPHTGQTSEQEQEIAAVKVKLKPVLGIRPPVYLIAIYSLLLAGILFLLLFYPGIRRPGSRVAFTSTPPGAAVYVQTTT